MAFDKTQWQQQFQEKLPGWRQRMQQAGVKSVYAFLSAAALWPVVEAAQRGEWATAPAALAAVAAGVGGNLLANLIQSWKDEAGGAHQLAARLDEEALREALTAVLQALNAFKLAQAALPLEERAWFVHAWQQELARWPQYRATLSGDGAIAQGSGATALGKGAVQITGNAQGPIITGSGNVVNSQPMPTELVAPLSAASRQLWRQMTQYFDNEEFQTLCFDLGIDDEQLPGQAKGNKMRALVSHCERNGRLDDLMAMLKAHRPHINWL